MFTNIKADIFNFRTFYGKFSCELRKILKNIDDKKYEFYTDVDWCRNPYFYTRFFLFNYFINFEFTFSERDITLEFEIVDPDNELEFSDTIHGQYSIIIKLQRSAKHTYNFKYVSDGCETDYKTFPIVKGSRETCNDFIIAFKNILMELLELDREFYHEVFFSSKLLSSIKSNVVIDRYNLAESIKQYFDNCFKQ